MTEAREEKRGRGALRGNADQAPNCGFSWLFRPQLNLFAKFPRDIISLGPAATASSEACPRSAIRNTFEHRTRVCRLRLPVAQG